MYRLLIVDDEEIIVNGLYEIFSNMKNLDLDVYKAYSGEEAIEWLNRTRIDIVLADIRMPGTDGLQLLNIIHKSWPQCRVIFLTAYNEFAYVYKAIQHKAVNYILKIEDNEKVIEAVNNAIRDIQQERKIENLVHKAKEQMNMAIDQFRNDYFIRLLHGYHSLHINKSQFDQLQIPMYSDKPVIMLVAKIDNIPDNLSYWDKLEYINSVKFIINQNLYNRVISVTVMDERYRFILFMQPKELVSLNKGQINMTTYYDKTISFLKGTLEVIQTTCRESTNTSVSFALSGTPCSWEYISQKYHSLNRLLSFRIGTGTEMLLIDNEFENNIINTSSNTSEMKTDTELLDTLMNRKKWDSIELFLELGQRDKFYKALSELLDPLKGIKRKKNDIAIETYYKVSLCLLSYINSYKLNEKVSYYVDLHRLMRIDEHESWKEAVEYIYTLSDFIFNIQEEEQNKRTDNEIYYIQKYVEEHLSEDLSLVKLAEQVYLNPSYLSRLYKDVTGSNLSDFIDDARIKKAKELLEKENAKIYEVAKAVGYDTASSFTRFFRRMCGCSPQEYRERFLVENRG